MARATQYRSLAGRRLAAALPRQLRHHRLCLCAHWPRKGPGQLIHWREALQAWSEEKLRKRSWRYMAPVNSGPAMALQPSPMVSVGGCNPAKPSGRPTKPASSHSRVVIGAGSSRRRDTDEPVMRAINHPVGQVTEALLRWWYRRSLEDGQGLPEEVRDTFTELCDTRVDKFRHGRVLLAAHVIAFFRVDPRLGCNTWVAFLTGNAPKRSARSLGRFPVVPAPIPPLDGSAQARLPRHRRATMGTLRKTMGNTLRC